MFPVLLDVSQLHVVLIGEGEEAEKRLALLDAAGAAHVRLFSGAPSAALVAAAGERLAGERPSDEALKGAGVVFIAGLDEAEAVALAGKARGFGRLVNTEDRKPLCDFHVPSVMRRGDLLLTVSTGGKSPGLARRLRLRLEALFGPEWAGRLEDLSRQRDAWRAEGISLGELARRADAYIDEKGWLS